VAEPITRAIVRRAPQVALMLVSLAFSVAAAEVVLRVVGGTRASYYVWPPGFHATLQPSPSVMPGIDGESGFSVSDQGLRGDRLDRQTSGILAVGGSTTECLYLDDSETWPYLLQRRLNATRGGNGSVWVGNAGRSGHTTSHHLLHAEHLPDLSPVIKTMLVLSGANDFLQRLQLDRGYRPPALVDHMSPDEYRSVGDRAFAVWPGFASDDPVWKRLELVRRLRDVKKRYTEPPWNVIQDSSGQIYLTWRANRRSASAFRNELPDLSPSLDAYVRNLQRIIALSKARGLRLILMTQPAIWRAGLSQEEQALLWMGGVGAYQGTTGREYYAPEALAAGLKQYNDALLRTCAATNVECLDLDRMLQKNSAVFYDDMHFTEAGARAVANIVGEYLETTSRMAAVAR
jgi:lysophospholipase L1-like esterase